MSESPKKPVAKISISPHTDTAELGSTGLRESSGQIQEEFLPELTHSNRLKIFREMRENDPVVGAMLFAVEMLIRQVEWRVEARSDEPQAIEVAEFIDGARQDMANTWEDTVSQVLDFLPFGYHLAEEVYKVRSGQAPEQPSQDSVFDDGRIGWAKLSPRPAETVQRWLFDPHGEVLGIVQNAPPIFATVPIPISRLSHFRAAASKNNPEGRSILRSSYRPWYFKKRTEEIEGIGIERDLAGMPMAEVPVEYLDENAPEEVKRSAQAIQRIVRNVRRNAAEGLMVPRAFDEAGNELFKFSLLTTGGRRQIDTTKIIQRRNMEIALPILADFILVGHEQAGSFSLHSDKTNLFATAVGGWAAMIQAVFNRFTIPRLVAANGWPLELSPTLETGDLENLDPTVVSDVIQKLFLAGLLNGEDVELENYVRRLVGAPQRDEDAADLDAAVERELERRRKGRKTSRLPTIPAAAR